MATKVNFTIGTAQATYDFFTYIAEKYPCSDIKITDTFGSMMPRATAIVAEIQVLNKRINDLSAEFQSL